MDHGVTRRGFLRRLGAGAAVVAGGGALAGCAGLGGLGARPSTQKTKILLTLRAWGYGSTFLSSATESTVDELVHEYTAPWRQKHPGVDVKILPNVGGPQAMVSALLGGTAPDIYHSWHPDAMFASPGFTTDLTKYLADAHANLGVFNAAQMRVFQQPDGIRGLPAYLGIVTLASNNSIIDAAGLERPAPGWSHQDYATLCQKISQTGGGNIVGGAFGLGNVGSPTGYLPPNCVLEGFGGSYVDPKDGAVCTLDSPQVQEAMNWIYPLARTFAIASPAKGGSLHQGTLGMALASTWDMIYYATTWVGFQWFFCDMPSFPATQAPVTSATSDFYALNPRSKYLDLAWDLLYWMSFDPYWQRGMMKVFLLSPSLVSLWDEWVTKVQTYAPPLADKNLATFARLAQGGHAYPQQFLRYQADVAYQYMNQWGAEIWNQTVSIPEGLQEMTHQVNGLQKTGAAEEAAAASPHPAGQYATPSRAGAGDPPTDGTPYVAVDATSGTVTLLGTGWDIYGTQDACVFYCKPSVHEQGSWICRVDAVSNISCPALSIWAKVGLMARGDLSDDAPMVALHVTGSNGIEWETRQMAGLGPTSASGLLPTGLKGALMQPVSSQAANFLTQPIWLRMDRDRYTWTAKASLDGQTWTTLGAPEVVQMDGCWIGVMATAHNGDFQDKGYIRATMDKLNFTPTTKVQLGIQGTAPAAGPVPANWATLSAANGHG